MDRDEMAALLNQIMETLYAGGPIPPADGGRVFHAICEERYRKGDRAWTERRLNDLARELGYWPWSVNEIAASRQPRRVEHPETVSAWLGADAPPAAEQEW